MIDRKNLDQVRAPIATARGLPNAFYADPVVFETEKQAVFAANWACIGFASDVPGAGDVKPVDFLGQPCVIVRGKDDVVRVFENVCRHRGMILVDKPAHTNGVIRCPYHSWCYGLDGSLRTTPHVGGPGQNRHDAMKREELGLNEIRSHVWMEMVFVNLSGRADPFETYAGDLLSRWIEFSDRPLFHGGPESSFKLEVACNWKLAVENYCESYHLPWIHPGLNSYSRLEDHYNIVQPGKFAGQGTVVYNPNLEDEGRTFSNFSSLTEKWDTGAEYIALFPNVLLGVHRDHTFAIMLEPMAHNRTLEHVEIYYTCEQDADAALSRLRSKNSDQWKEIFEEDIFVVEGMQKGRSAANFDGGKFSPVMDEATHCFHDWAAAQFETA
ncbi:MAG: aromatic ring-hydroxylating dioxygenase subunit alpha [Alphaproteobacteria bacterium]|nr:aromatic ring-hydroxylating dioxygenase subunit alpha [Alphaproteobacteria bacterium]